ncbi:uncharacterized protein LOC116002928 isoform X2 [Ipomoea triloba]|uniref:uncharacterized protein LOC116002928 isoform X2 n=1 Tax=Ipomoea triloba TaxID=35885 RepID=UPI00125D0B15|nr:uncharacterized protein LOC116002928 isoform X2 [Ipomoea triloba]
MAANTSGVSNPKLDVEYEDEGDDDWSSASEWDYVLREISSGSLKKDGPVIHHLCKLALIHYQNSYPGETYEFVSLQKVLCGLVSGIEYSVTFSAKNLKSNVVETFEARGYDFIGEDELKIVSCALKE